MGQKFASLPKSNQVQMNTETQSSTQVFPAFLNFKRHLDEVRSLRREIEDMNNVIKIKEEDRLERIKELDALRDSVYKDINYAVDIQKARFNKNRKDVHYSKVNSVLRRSHYLSDASKSINSKLEPTHNGPYTV